MIPNDIPLDVWLLMVGVLESNRPIPGYDVKSRIRDIVDARDLPAIDPDLVATIDYTNHEGQRRVRRIGKISVFHGTTPHHPGLNYFLEATDLDRGSVRHFAVACIHSYREVTRAMSPVQA